MIKLNDQTEISNSIDLPALAFIDPFEPGVLPVTTAQWHGSVSTLREQQRTTPLMNSARERKSTTHFSLSTTE